MTLGLEPSALGPWAQRQDGLTRACPVVVILVLPPPTPTGVPLSFPIRGQVI